MTTVRTDTSHGGMDRTWAASPDQASLDELIDRYTDKVRRTAWRVTRCDTAAQDVTQEVFLRVWRHGGFTPGRGSLEVWLQMMARHIAIDWIRREARHRRRLVAVEAIRPGPAPVVEEAVLASVQAVAVRAAVAGLPDDERAVVTLAYFDGLSYRQVAAQLGLPEGTVKSRIRRALTRLAIVVGPASTLPGPVTERLVGGA